MTTIAETKVKVEAEAIGLDVRRIAANTSNWSSPIVLAIFAAAVAGFGNSIVFWWNGQLEDRRAEHARTLEVIKTGNVKQAAENLEFLVQIGLVASPTVNVNESSFMRQTQSLASARPYPPEPSGSAMSSGATQYPVEMPILNT